MSPILTMPSARASGMVSCMRFRQRTKVLLPHPDGPMTAVTWLACTVMSMDLSARFLPVHALQFPRPYWLGHSLQGSTAGGDAHRRDRRHDHDDQNQRARPRLLVPL